MPTPFPDDLFVMTLRPTADEVVAGTVVVHSPDKDGATKVTGVEHAITARVWEGTTNRGEKVEVGIVRFLQISPAEEDRLREVLKNVGEELPSHFPEEVPDGGA